MKKITRRSMLKGSAVAAAALALSACGGSSSSTASSASTAASAAGTAAADDIGFPKKETITLAVPGKAGGGSDLAIRYYSEGLNRIYGLKTTVTNYDSNTVGHQTVANAKPDGTTLMVATSALNIQYITGNAQVNPMTDLTLIMGPSGMDETMVKEMNAAMQAVVEDPTVNEGIAGIGHIPGWHDLEESEELHQKEYDELVEIAKSLDMYVQG